MSDKKYEFTGETINVNGHELHQIRYLTDIYTIGDFGKPSRILSEGEIGGWIEREENLSQDGEHLLMKHQYWQFYCFRRCSNSKKFG